MQNLENIIRETLSEVLDQMGIEYEKIEVESDDNESFKVLLESETSSALLIGWHGETMMALQYILKVLVWAKLGSDSDESFLLTLDIDNYRERQEENVRSLAKRKVEEALEMKSNVTLPPMSPYFRRQVHLYIAEMGDEHVTSESVGEGSERRIKIVYSD